MSKTYRIIIVLLFVAAFFLRVYRLDNVPPSPSLDEVSIGYNAYSIAKTGMDEYKTRLPIVLRAYDDWRPGLYVYLVSAMVPFFGLSMWAVRLPSMVLSLVTIYITYQTALLLGRKHKERHIAAMWTLGCISFSAWHIYISRLGHEVNLGLTLFTVGAYALCHFVVTRKTQGLYWAAVFLALSLYGYQSEKAIIPVFLGASLIGGWKQFLGAKKHAVYALIIFVLCAAYAVVLTVSPEGMTRIRGTSAVSADSPIMVQARLDHAKAVGQGNRLAALVTSRPVTALRVISSNYLMHFSPLWLFSGSQSESHKVPYMGLLYWWQGILILAGVWYMRHKVPREVFWIIIAWMLSAPVPAALTTQAPHAMRTLTAVVPLMICAGFGSYAITKHKYAKLWIAGILLLHTIGASVFVKNYFTVFPREQSDSFQYAMAETIKYVQNNEASYRSIVFSNEGALYQSYMFFLYYTKMDPRLYFHHGGTRSGGYAESHIIGKYSFRKIDLHEPLLPEVLYLYDANSIPAHSTTIQTFLNKDGEGAIVAVTL